MNSIFKVVATLGVIAVDWFVSTALSPVSMIGSAAEAGKQLQNSDAAAVTSQIGMSFFQMPGVVESGLSVASALLIGVIWWSSIKKLGTSNTAAIVGGIGLAGMLATPHAANAYWSQSDIAEAIGIPANSTAFWIPNIGDTAGGQTQTEDADFYNSKKVPGRIFFVPHQKFRNSGGWASWDYFVPTGHMILVDRTPYTREWTADATTGTGKADESFHCQTKEGINVRAEVSIATSISPNNAATFLYYFGVNNVEGADPNDPAVIFASVYRAKTLTTVMDGIGHGLVEVAVCNAIGERTLNEANRDYIPMMTEDRPGQKSILTSTKEYLTARGITVDYMGWAGTFYFDPDVQHAINQTYIASQVAPILGTLQRSASISAVEGWDHHLPGVYTVVGSSPNVTDMLSGLLSAGSSAVAPAATVAPSATYAPRAVSPRTR